MRFSEFSDEWENKKLGDLMTFKVTNSYSRDNLNYESGIVKNIHYGDIHTKFQTLFDLEKENVPYINEDISLNRISKDFYCQEGDVIFADASEDLNDVGKSIEITNLNGEKLLSGLHTLLARPQKNNFSKGFLGYLLKSDFVRNQIKRESQGSKVLSINVARISNIHLVYPSIPEQQKISEFLSLLDERIQTQKKIIEQLETLIKGVGYKLFNKKIRFKNNDFSEFPSWENKKGNEVFSNISNKNHNSELPILAITQEHGAIPRDLIDFRISVTDKSVESYKVVEKGDFIISLRSFQGGIEYSEYKGICSPAYIILRNKTEVNNYFYKYYFKSESYIKQLNKKLEGIRDGKMISYAYFSDINLPLPSINEQTKIANFLSLIQEKIEIEKQILEKLEFQKKFLLANLFV